MNLTRELKTLWNMWVTVISIVIGALGTVLKDLERVLDELQIGGRIKTIESKSSRRSARNTEKSPENLRSLVVTQTPMKDH